jgi:hypothetical protein
LLGSDALLNPFGTALSLVAVFRTLRPERSPGHNGRQCGAEHQQSVDAGAPPRDS